MASDKIKKILQAVSQVSQRVMSSADKAVPPEQSCPTCKRPLGDVSEDLIDSSPNKESSYDK